jgi:hypothetical protein
MNPRKSTISASARMSVKGVLSSWEASVMNACRLSKDSRAGRMARPAMKRPARRAAPRPPSARGSKTVRHYSRSGVQVHRHGTLRLGDEQAQEETL